MAGFEVIIYGRFWVIAKDICVTHYTRVRPSNQFLGLSSGLDAERVNEFETGGVRV
jgi:hypothetical protein